MKDTVAEKTPLLLSPPDRGRFQKGSVGEGVKIFSTALHTVSLDLIVVKHFSREKTV